MSEKRITEYHCDACNKKYVGDVGDVLPPNGWIRVRVNHDVVRDACSKTCAGLVLRMLARDFAPDVTTGGPYR